MYNFTLDTDTGSRYIYTVRHNRPFEGNHNADAARDENEFDTLLLQKKILALCCHKFMHGSWRKTGSMTHENLHPDLSSYSLFHFQKTFIYLLAVRYLSTFPGLELHLRQLAALLHVMDCSTSSAW